jgi:hypothetical protein
MSDPTQTTNLHTPLHFDFPGHYQRHPPVDPAAEAFILRSNNEIALALSLGKEG